ncbi:MAG TPA: hypothetical protein VHO25_07165 [Polyangiaceae bacterium]|nr:hypothetical protein [Polyangiaceae bacterium]
MESYASAIVPPSTAVSAAASTLAGALTTAFGSPLAAPGMELAFTAFATTIAAGQAPAFVGAPPGGPVGFAAQFLAPKPPSHAAAGAALSALIQAWMITGSATPSGGGAPSPWS